MSKEQHTPGPWARFCPDPGDEETFAIQKLEGHSPRLDHYILICDNIRQKGGGPDAHLIAAAPDLLASLVGLLAYTDTCLNQSAAIFAQARVAIAKATIAPDDPATIEATAEAIIESGGLEGGAR